MEKPRVYIETTMVSYLVARPNRDLVTAARQQTTREWWETCLPSYIPCVSDMVDEEIRDGDEEMVKRRLSAIAGFHFPWRPGRRGRRPRRPSFSILILQLVR